MFASCFDKWRNRLPGPLADAPTDADYAIEIITQRIARGEEIKPLRKPRSSSARANSANEADLSAISSPDTSSRNQMQTNDGVDWKKWGSRVAHGKLLLSEGKQRLSSGQVNTVGLTYATLRDEETHSTPIINQVVIQQQLIISQHILHTTLQRLV
jgi:hypothetical protein